MCHAAAKTGYSKGITVSPSSQVDTVLVRTFPTDSSRLVVTKGHNFYSTFIKELFTTCSYTAFRKTARCTAPCHAALHLLDRPAQVTRSQKKTSQGTGFEHPTGEGIHTNPPRRVHRGTFTDGAIPRRRDRGTLTKKTRRRGKGAHVNFLSWSLSRPFHFIKEYLKDIGQFLVPRQSARCAWQRWLAMSSAVSLSRRRCVRLVTPKAREMVPNMAQMIPAPSVPYVPLWLFRSSFGLCGCVWINF